LIEQYDLDSIASGEVGDFTNEELSSLYEQLLAQGAESLEDALAVGALIEEVDIQDLQTAIAETDNADVIAVYTNLLDASESHLNAFVGQLENLGITYEAQVLSEDELADILADDQQQEHGNGNGKGHNSANQMDQTLFANESNGQNAHGKGFIHYQELYQEQGSHGFSADNEIAMVGVEPQGDCIFA